MQRRQKVSITVQNTKLDIGLNRVFINKQILEKHLQAKSYISIELYYEIKMGNN